MTQFEQLDQLVDDNDGIIQTSQVKALKISKTVFYTYIKSKHLEQVAHGIYVSEDAWLDSMYLFQLRFKQAIFSHETALYFHDLTDREPSPYSVTVKTGYNASRLKADGVQVFSIKKEFHEIGIVSTQTPFGHTVLTYDMERTLCDLIRSRRNIEIQTLQDALKQYVCRKEKNLLNLMKYAKIFHVEKILRQYLEVLL